MALTRFQNVEQIEKDVDEIIRGMEQLRRRYEQYFLGLVKENPIQLREKISGLIRKNHGIPIQNARLKFRYQQAISRFNTYCTYWDRILRKIEEGTYERDVFKAKLNMKHRHAIRAEDPQQHTDDMYQLYQSFQTAKDGLNQQLDHVSYKKFQQQLQAKKIRLQEKHKDHDISFKIKKDKGKVKIIPVAIKKN